MSDLKSLSCWRRDAPLSLGLHGSCPYNASSAELLVFFLILECRIFIVMQSHRDLLHQEVRCQSLERYVLRGFSRRSQYWMGESSRVWGPRGILINHIIFNIFTVSHLQLKYLTKVSCKLAAGETWTMWGIIAGFKLQISSLSWLEEIGELLEC